MNEYDDILNRIVEEFYDTGKVVLNELDDIPDELKILGTEAQLKIKKELDDILRKAKHTDKNAAYKKSKEYYEQFLIDVQQLLDKSEYEKQIEFVEEQLKMIDNILDYKKEKTEFEKSIDNLEDLEIGTKTSKTLYNVNTDKIIEIFQSNECLYNELINNNSKIREFIIKHFDGEYCSKTDNKCLKNNNKFINHINKIELNEKDKKSIIINLTQGGTIYGRDIQGLCEVDPMEIINSNITTTHSKESEVEKSLPENSITKEVKDKLNKSYTIIQNIISEIEKNEVVKQIPSFKNVYSDLMSTIIIYTKGAGENKSLTTKVQKDIEGSLNMIIYDLYQLYLLVQSFEVYGDKEKKKIKDIIENISKQINDKEKLSENFFKIREIRNQKYEASFECNDKTYFEKTKGGNNPKIIDVTNNNQYLMKLIENGDKPYVIATEIYNQIDTKIIVKGLEKHDIKSNQVIILENGTTIPSESKIEVKLTSRYNNYHLSEFFGVYKNKPLDEHTDTYNQVITELKVMLEKDDKGIIQKIKDTTAGIFYENYMYTPIGNVKIEWSDMGQRPTEKRLSLRVSVIDESKISQWTKLNGNCNCEPFLKGVECPQNESTDRLDEIIENFFDTGRLKLKEELGSDEEDRISNTETKEYDDIYNDSENISQQEEKYKYAFEEYYKNLIDLKSVAESLEIPYDTVRKWVQLENKEFNYFIIKNYNLTNEQLITIKYFRRKVFYQWGKEKGISWNEQKKMYDYPEIPTIEEIESLVDKVNNNTIEKDKSWSNLYSNSVYFPRKKSAMNTFAVVNRINTMLKLQHGYNDVTIEEYWGLIKQLMEYSNQRTPKEKEELVEKIIEFIKLGDVTMDSLRKEFNVSQSTIQRLFIEYNLYDLYYENKSDVTYESSFETDCGIGKYFKRTGKQGNSSKISTGNYNIYLKEKIESENQTEILISEIYKTISKDGIVKYDLEILKPVKLTNGNNRILLTNKSKNKKFVEVKDIPYEKPYPLIEFYSIFKDPNLKSIKDDWLNKYGDNLNYILNGLSEMLNDDVDKQKGKGWEIIEKIKDNISGIFFNNYNFLPNDSYDLRWSTKGLRSEPRLSIEVNYKQGGNVYRWVEGNCNIQKNESTDRLDNIIENFFDTGKFVF